MLIVGAEIDGRAPLDVRIADGRIAAIAPALARIDGEPTLDAGGGALLPGLHDHHVHLFALAAARASVQCGPPHVADAASLERALRAAATAGAPERGLRGVGYHESVAGELDRGRLDAWIDDRALRVQHRSGALWVLNSRAVEQLGLDAGVDAPGVERDRRGRATGRLYDLDGWLREQLPAAPPPDLSEAGCELAACGVTGVTDASPGNASGELAAFGVALGAGALRQRVVAMGAPGRVEPPHPDVAQGCVKLMLAERALPHFEALQARIAAAHREGRCVAVHCVTRAELHFAMGAIEAAGVRAGDRIEHASVAPPEAAARLAQLGLIVVTQPNFLFERGDAYAADVEPIDRPWLYRGRGLLEAGVALGGGTDAPYGAPDPWLAMRAAVCRRSRGGAVLAGGEALTPERALALFTTPPEAPGGDARRVAVGADADLCLLDAPWRVARRELTRERVAATLRAGALTWLRAGPPDRPAAPRV